MKIFLPLLVLLSALFLGCTTKNAFEYLDSFQYTNLPKESLSEDEYVCFSNKYCTLNHDVIILPDENILVRKSFASRLPIYFLEGLILPITFPVDVIILTGETLINNPDEISNAIIQHYIWN